MSINTKILDEIEQLPTLPQVVTKIVDLVENPTTSAQEITKVVSFDPPLAAKILKIVNSAYYGFPKEIRTITHAVMILGFDEVKNIALSISVFDFFKDKTADKVNNDRTAFWQHSIAVAVCAKLLAKRRRMKNQEEVFIAGLLHDIGKIILDQFFHNEFKQIIMKVRNDGILFVNAERQLFDLDHAEIGQRVTQKWGLPDSIIDCIAYHHDPSNENVYDDLVAFVHAADVIVRVQKIGNGGDDYVPQLKKEAWKKLSLKPGDIEKIYQDIHQEVEKAGTFLELTK